MADVMVMRPGERDIIRYDDLFMARRDMSSGQVVTKTNRRIETMHDPDYSDGRGFRRGWAFTFRGKGKVDNEE